MLVDVPGGVETHDVFHYTSAEPGILILQSMRLRLGSFETMNDLREARQNRPGFGAHQNDADSITNGMNAMQLMDDMDWYLRRFVKIACFTRDFEPAPGAWDHTGVRGWAHPALWAHYGAGHTGMVLRFNRPRLIEALSNQHSASGRVYAGNVLYPNDPLPAPVIIDAGQIKEFGLDAAVLDYMDQARHDLLFTKNIDWAPEQEFRLLLIGAELAPAWLDISDCLTGVYFGESFSDARLDVAQEILQDHPDVAAFKLHYFNRQFMAMPPREGAKPPEVIARRSGSLESRLRELGDARLTRERALGSAQDKTLPILQLLRERFDLLRDDLSARSGVEFGIHPHVTAIPPERRQRAPGVPGEVIDLDTGLLLTANVSLGEHTAHSYSVSFGLSALAEGGLRFHALVERRALQLTEKWMNDEELWRGGPIEVDEGEAAKRSALELLKELAEKAVEYLDTFTGPLDAIAAAIPADPLDVPNCPVCARPMEPVKEAGIVLWKCGYGDH